jgi:hypothetical protein
MKLMWFHPMPYTELPDDFRDASPSVWVDIHSALFDPKRALLMYNDFMDEPGYAAARGFDAVCVNEHYFNGYGLMPKLRDVHAGWDDRWWPRPMAVAQRAEIPAFMPSLAAG